MSLFKSNFRFSFWHVVLCLLLLAVMTWIWFGMHIEIINRQIDNLHK